MRRLLAFIALPATTASAQPLAIQHVTVVDVTDGSRQPDQTVLIDGARIAAVGAADGRLHLTTLDSERPARPLVHLGDHTFGFPEAPADRLVFRVHAGQARGYALYWDGLFSNYRQRVAP